MPPTGQIKSGTTDTVGHNKRAESLGSGFCPVIGVIFVEKSIFEVNFEIDQF